MVLGWMLWKKLLAKTSTESKEEKKRGGGNPGY